MAIATGSATPLWTWPIAPVTGSSPRTVLFRLRTTDSNNGYFWGWGATATGGAYRCRVLSTRLSLEFVGTAYAGTTNLIDGLWHSVCVRTTANANDTVVSIDGALESGSVGSTALATQTNPMRMNRSGSGGSGKNWECGGLFVWEDSLPIELMHALTSGRRGYDVRLDKLRLSAPMIALPVTDRVIPPGPVPITGGFSEFNANHPRVWGGPAVQFINMGGPGPAPPSNSFLTDLIAHWDCDENGGTRFDSHTNNLHLDQELTGTIPSEPGVINDAMDLTGLDAIRQASQSDLLATSGDMTFIMWHKPEASYSGNVRIAGKYGGGASRHYAFYATSSGLIQFRRATSDGEFVAFTPVPLIAGTWRMYAGVHSGSEIILYVDGVEVDRVAITGTPNTGPQRFEAGDDAIVTGSVDEMLVADRAWSRDEIVDYYNGGAGTPYADFQ